jgi:thiol-disulfide isomerase/thioredoxin
MALKESNMLPIGTLAPPFSLVDTVSGNTMSLEDTKGEKGTIVIFSCNHCPYVKYLNSAIVEMAKVYQAKQIGFVMISSNDVVKYPADSPELMRETALTEGYTFPYLYDETQAVARTYEAACTPDFYLFDADLRLVYRGRFDGARPNNDISITGADLRAALNALLAGTPISEKQYPSAGCNIKWKA